MSAHEDHQHGRHELTDAQRSRLAELDAELERDDPQLARLARRDQGGLARQRVRASWLAGADRHTRRVVALSAVAVVAVNIQMFLLALRGGNLLGLVVTVVVFLAVAWLLTRPAVPPPTSPPLDRSVH